MLIMKQKYLWLLIGLICLVVAPNFVYPIFLIKALCFALFASAFNLLIGYTGLLSFGHAAFFGTAGYIVGLSMKYLGWTPEFALIAGVAVAAILGVLIGGLAIRRQGIYFAMITLALSQLIYFIAMQTPITGRDDGLQGIPRGKLFGIIDLSDDIALYGLVCVCVVGAIALIVRIVYSPYGEVLKAIRENEPRAVSLGYDVNQYKLLAFVLSAAIAGLAGGLKVLALSYESLNDLHWSLSGEVILMSLLGGLGTISGPVIGAFFVITLQTWLADKVGGWVSVIIGVIFVTCVMAFRKGFVGELDAWWHRSRKQVEKTAEVGIGSIEIEQGRSS